MPTAKLARLGGAASISAGPLWAWGFLGLEETFPPYSHAGGHLLLALAALFSLGALLGLSTVAVGRVGRSGKAGLALATLGSLLVLVGNALEGGFEVDLGWALFMLGLLALLAGLALLGLAALRADVLPHWVALPLLLVPPLLLLATIATNVLVQIVGLAEPTPESPLLILPMLVSMLLFGGSWVLVGLALWSGGDGR